MAALSRRALSAILYSMKYKLYTSSQKAWDGMLEAMAAARQSIYLEMYIFLDDTETTHDFFSLLEAKARAGLEVVIVADYFGSYSLSAKAIKALRAAGVEFLYFNHWFRHTHRKILIIDQKVAFLGGVNIARKISNWLDLQIRLEGHIVEPLLKSFAHAYELAGGKREAILQFRRRLLTKKIKSWVTDNLGVVNRPYYLNNYYKTRLSEAQRSITIVTPYLLPPHWLIRLLDEAAQRGVQVEVLIPNDTDIKPINRVNYLNACRLASFGARVYLMPAMNHAKIMIIDGQEGVIGSQNMDVLSFNFNIEAGVFFRQKDLIDDLARIVTHWKEGAVTLEAVRRPVNLGDRFWLGALKIFYSVF